MIMRTQEAEQATHQNNVTTIEPRKLMHAVVYDDYGDASVLRTGVVEIPRRLPGQLLIHVEASSVNPIDYRLRRGELKGLLLFGFPRIPGYDVAGHVVDCDLDAPFKPGDRVMAYLDHLRGGACAEFVVCPTEVAAKISDSMPSKEAAAIPLAGTTALQSLRDHGRIAPGKRVLINGASGGVGAFAVQIAKHYEAHITAVASGFNEDFCLELGADTFLDYQNVDFTKSGEQWDLIFDVVGKSGYLEARSVLTESGRYVSTEPSAKGLFMTLVTRLLSKTGTIMLAKPSATDLGELTSLYELGKLSVTIDSQFSMNQASDAHRRVEQGVDRGKVVLVNRF